MVWGLVQDLDENCSDKNEDQVREVVSAVLHSDLQVSVPPFPETALLFSLLFTLFSVFSCDCRDC